MFMTFEFFGCLFYLYHSIQISNNLLLIILDEILQKSLLLLVFSAFIIAIEGLGNPLNSKALSSFPSVVLWIAIRSFVSLIGCLTENLTFYHALKTWLFVFYLIQFPRWIWFYYCTRTELYRSFVIVSQIHFLIWKILFKKYPIFLTSNWLFFWNAPLLLYEHSSKYLMAFQVVNQLYYFLIKNKEYFY